MEANILFAGVAALILLAVTSMRYGADGRECLASKERELAARGIVWDGTPSTPVRPTMSASRVNLDVPGQEQANECVPVPCGA